MHVRGEVRRQSLRQPDPVVAPPGQAPLAEPVHDTANLLHRRAAARRQLRDGAGPERDRTDDRDLVGVHPLERRGERVDGAQPLGQLGEAARCRLHQCVRAVLQQRRQRARIQTGQVARETLLAHQMRTRCPGGVNSASVSCTSNASWKASRLVTTALQRRSGGRVRVDGQPPDRLLVAGDGPPDLRPPEEAPAGSR